MIASRFSWSAGTLFSKQNKKKRLISGFLSDFSTEAKETNTHSDTFSTTTGILY